MEQTNHLQEYIPILIQFAVAIGFVGFVMVASTFWDPKEKKTADKLASFECGIDSKGNARLPFSIKYFLTAILFVLFDVELIFLYPWAMSFKEVGFAGFVEIMIFMGVLLLGFIYIIKKAP